MLRKPISNIKKTFWLLLVALSAVTTPSAQQSSCSAKIDQLADAPELRGFHLGMTYDQVKARVPLIQFGRADQFGVAKTSINPSFGPQFDKASFADVRTISLDFMDGKLVTLWIGYESAFKWQKLDEFVAGMSKVLNLPAAWSPKSGGQQLVCDGFSLFASLIAGSPGIRISDDAAQETIANRREEAAAAAEAAEAAVIGDQRTKLYYLSGCSEREKVPENGRVTFKDKDEAEKAGYKLAKDCQSIRLQETHGCGHWARVVKWFVEVP
jgi:hypothetical protein